MIFAENPTDWKDLQDKVALILQQCGFVVESPKKLASARSELIEVDVYATDESSIIRQMIICECKYWDNKVPQSVVHAFRAQLDDIGANLGLLISKNGFQSGSYSASKYTNIKLLTWQEFEELFFPKWYELYFLKEAGNLANELIEYIVPDNTYIINKLDVLPKSYKYKYKTLIQKHYYLSTLCLNLYSDYCKRSYKIFYGEPDLYRKYCLPFDKYYNPERLNNFPEELINTKSYISLLKLLKKYTNIATNEFKDLFYEAEQHI